jgi:cytidylate kinase
VSEPASPAGAAASSPATRGTLTLSRQYGAGGLRIAPAVAEALGFRFVDRELVEMAARQLGVDPEWAREHDERVPDVLENLGRALAAATPEFGVPPPPILDDGAMADAVRNVIHSLADTGGYLILGRASQAALADRSDVCNVLLVAPLPDRIARIMRSQEVNEKDARGRVDRVDRDRADYVRRFYDRDIADPTLYDVVVNTSRLGLRGSARLAVAAARAKLGAAASTGS